MDELSPLEGNKKNPLKDTFRSIKEFSDAMEENCEISMMSNIQTGKIKTGEIIHCCKGIDGKFYILIEKGGQFKYHKKLESIKEVNHEMVELQRVK